MGQKCCQATNGTRRIANLTLAHCSVKMSCALRLPFQRVVEYWTCCPGWDGKVASEVLGSGAAFFYSGIPSGGAGCPFTL